MKNRSADIPISDNLTFSKVEVLELVFANTQEMFMLVDTNLRIITANELTRRTIFENLSIKISQGSSVLELVPPDKHKELIGVYEKVFRGEEHCFETPVEKNNSIIYFESFFKPARNRAGEIVAALVTTKDISGLKKDQANLREIEERWRFALEGGNQGVWDWNVQTGDIFFSDSYKKLYGYKQGDLKGRIEEWERMIHPDDKERMSSAIEEHLSGLDPYYESTYRVKTKDGNYKWVLGRGMLIRNEEGKPVRMIGTHTDITKQVTAEQTYRVLFNSNPLPMWTYDLETLRILSVNNAAVEHYGYSKDEFLSLTIKDIRPKEELPYLMQLIEKRKANPYLNRTTARHLKKNGQVIIVEISAHKLGDSNTVLVVAQDITERKYTEQVLSLERNVFELSNQPGIDFKYLAETLLKGFEEINDDAYSSLILLKDDNSIESFVAPRLPEEYTNTINGIKIGPSAGSCGTAMWRKEIIIVENISSHPLWDHYKHLALKSGLPSSSRRIIPLS